MCFYSRAHSTTFLLLIPLQFYSHSTAHSTANSATILVPFFPFYSHSTGITIADLVVESKVKGEKNGNRIGNRMCSRISSRNVVE